MMKSFLTRIAQVLVGGLFIFSGLVKMNDPVGFSFKLRVLQRRSTKPSHLRTVGIASCYHFGSG